MFRIIILNILLISTQLLFGQAGSIYTDKPFYFEGDQINYSYNGSTSIIVEIYDQNGIVDRELSLLSPASGELQLSENKNSQWVLLRAYQWNAEASVHLVEQRFIPVYGSDVINDIKIDLTAMNQGNIASHHNAGSSIDINLPGSRDSWILSAAYAEVTDEIYKDYPYGVSYYADALTEEAINIAVEVPNNHSNGLHGLFNLSTGQTTFGRVKGDGTILMVPLYTTKDDLNGLWSMITVPSIGSVQASTPVFISSNRFLDLPNWPSTSPAKVENLGALYRDHLELRQINMVFANKLAAQMESSPLSSIEPDRSFRVEDFVRFQTTKEFFEEVVSASKVIEKDGLLDVRLLANNKKYADAAPLTIYNGRICGDINEILNSKIDEVTVYFKTQRLLEEFGITGRNGVMIVNSEENNICSNSSIELLDSSTDLKNHNVFFNHVLIREESSGSTNRYRFNDLRNTYVQISIDRKGNVLKGNVFYKATGKNLK